MSAWGVHWELAPPPPRWLQPSVSHGLPWRGLSSLLRPAWVRTPTLQMSLQAWGSFWKVWGLGPGRPLEAFPYILIWKVAESLDYALAPVAAENLDVHMSMLRGN